MINVTEIALREHQSASAVSERPEPPCLVAQWYKDAQGALVMRWIRNPEPEDRRYIEAA
jgi:hypothetical protein